MTLSEMDAAIKKLKPRSLPQDGPVLLDAHPNSLAAQLPADIVSDMIGLQGFLCFDRQSTYLYAGRPLKSAPTMTIFAEDAKAAAHVYSEKHGIPISRIGTYLLKGA